MKKIVLLRHGQTTVTGKYVGATDIPLSIEGESHITKVKASLSAFSFDNVFCSPMKRCTQTSDILSFEKPEIDVRLREINFGSWEGMSFAEITLRYPEMIESWAKQNENFCFPGGEKISDFRDRLTSFSNSLYTSKGSEILIISHGGVIRHLICMMLKLPLHNYLYFKIGFGKIACIELYEEGGILTALNW